MNAVEDQEVDLADESKLEAQHFEAPVVGVTVLEDRAHVVRRGTASLPAGSYKLTVPDVAPVICDRSLTASTEEGVRLHDVRVERAEVVLEDDRPQRAREVESELRAIELEMEAAQRLERHLENELATLCRLAQRTIEEIAVDSSWGRAAGDEWTEQIRLVAREQQEVRQRRVRQRIELERLRVKKRDLEALAGELESPRSRSRASIELDLTIDESGDHRIQIDYVVPGACWRPCHRARLVNEPKTHVLFEYGGCVWQNTGEDWRAVELLFSTQRPSLGMEPPILSEDVIRLRKKQLRVEVEARDEEIYTTGVDGGGPSVRSAELPGIDDGGEVVNLRAPEVADIPSDGRPYRVTICRFESPASLEHVCMPEVEASVCLKSAQINRIPYPLLAGPVDLIRDSGLVGRTSVLYVASGEQFDLGWGPDPELRVHRKFTDLDARDKMMSFWRKTTRSVDVHLSNLGPEEKRITLVERVPVSEIDKVQVEVHVGRTSEGRRPDSDGFVRWNVSLPAFGQRSIALCYSVSKHKAVAEV